MKDLFCNEFQFFIYAELRDLRSTLIANCIFNNCLTYTTVMLNVVTIYAIYKTSTMERTLKTLLLSLACSDVAVGLFSQPFYTFFQVNWLQLDNLGCNTLRLLYILSHFFSVASFFGVVAVSVDRFSAIHLHLRYQELVTHKRVVVVVIGIWMWSAFVSFGLILTFVVYIKIYLTARRHKNQIQSLQVQEQAQSDEIKSFALLFKSTVGVFYVYLAFLVCYLPYFICLILTSSSVNFFLFSLTLVYLNSSLNPVIYCWKMRHIRHAIMDILWKVSQRRNQPSRAIYNRAASVVHVDN
ncbi:melanocortin receptor 5-like [Stylophora pistillata]|uniref:melanocortin receptor 5-like n=1 Tax=Stylophora pistillata TaxID=50429 RepID=UPI000C03D89C|nr:melanocortin receptor 5-like [Stylophora pistillata]